MDTKSSVNYRLKASPERYEDALDAISFYAAKHPEWRAIKTAIEDYVKALEATAGRHEPGV